MTHPGMTRAESEAKRKAIQAHDVKMREQAEAALTPSQKARRQREAVRNLNMRIQKLTEQISTRERRVAGLDDEIATARKRLASVQRTESNRTDILDTVARRVDDLQEDRETTVLGIKENGEALAKLVAERDELAATVA